MKNKMEKQLRIDSFNIESYKNENINKDWFKCTIQATINYGMVEQPIKAEGRSEYKGRSASRAFDSLFKERIEDETRKQVKHTKSKYVEVPYSLNQSQIDFNGFEEAKEQFVDYTLGDEKR